MMRRGEPLEHSRTRRPHPSGHLALCRDEARLNGVHSYKSRLLLQAFSSDATLQYLPQLQQVYVIVCDLVAFIAGYTIKALRSTA